MIRVAFGPIPETVYIDIILNTITERYIDQCDVIARANIKKYYQNIRWGKGLIKSRNNESYTFHL